MPKNKLTLSKSELVEIISSTVMTIQEQSSKIKTTSDLAATMGNFGGFYNWQWGTELSGLGGEKGSYTPNAFQITDNHSKSTSKLRFESQELSTWDTGEEYFYIILKLTPTDYIKEVAKLSGLIDLPKTTGGLPWMEVKIKSDPPTNAAGTANLGYWVKKGPDPKMRRKMVGIPDSYNTVKGGRTNFSFDADLDNRIELYFRVNVDPAFWYNQSENGKKTYNWPIGATARGDKEESEVIEEQGMASGMAGNTNYGSGQGYLNRRGVKKTTKSNKSSNYRGHIPYKWTTQIEFLLGGVIQGNAEVVIDVDLKLGTMGYIVQKEFIKQSPYTADGAKPFSKSNWNPKNWSFNTKLDALAFVLFVIAGFFTEGVGWIAAARYLSLAAYATVVGINAYDYIKQGKHDMAGIHLLFEVLMFTKPLKWFKGGVEWLKTSKGVTWASLKIGDGLKYIRMGANLKTVKSAKPVLDLLRKNPGARRMVRILAEGGETALTKLKGNLKRAGSYKDVTKEMAEEFIKVITKANPEFIGKITVIQARKIIAEGSKRTSSRMLQAIVAVPEMIVSSLILISLYDVNMIIYPFQVFVLGLDPKKYKPSKTTPLANLQEYLYKKIGKSDIDFKLPMYDINGKQLVLQDLFGWWRVADLITTTKMPDSAFNYKWDDVRAKYVASISSLHVKAGNCPSIPKERYNLYTSNQYTPKSEEEKNEWEAKQKMGTAGKYQGVPIEAKNLIGRADINVKLKEDWVDGWRPEHQCQVIDLQDVIKLTAEDIVIKNIETLPPPDGGDPKKNDSEWKVYIKAGAERYKTINNGDYLNLEYGGVSYIIAGNPLPEVLVWFNTLPPKVKDCFKSLMASLASWNPVQESSSKFVAWKPPKTCSSLGVDWEDWLSESTIDLK